MTTQEILDLLAKRANNARIVSKHNDSRTFTHAEHWEIIALIVDDLADYIRHNSN